MSFRDSCNGDERRGEREISRSIRASRRFKLTHKIVLSFN
jgi:hypothetical protein